MIRENTTKRLPFERYDKIVVLFSGGKDSLACLLHLLDLGVDREKIELWHHLVDGKDSRLMDWPVTERYCEAVASSFKIPLKLSWREGGFEREMLREGDATAPIGWEEGRARSHRKTGGHGPEGTRLRFPQVSADLRVRWCSAYLKIDVGRRVLSNDIRFKTGKFLLVSGERREESSNRAKYAELERHASTNRKRRVDQWRAVLDWTEREVWKIIEKHRVRPHPAYALGWGRVSCALCIFGNRDQWAAAKELLPAQFERVAEYEEQFGSTIKRNESVRQQADKGTSFLPDDPEARARATAESYWAPQVRVPASEKWELPMGAFKKTGGPS